MPLISAFCGSRDIEKPKPPKPFLPSLALRLEASINSFKRIDVGRVDFLALQADLDSQDRNCDDPMIVLRARAAYSGPP